MSFYKQNINFYNSYYDDVLQRYSGMQSAWHHFKFQLFKEKIKPTDKHLDIGCSSGSFIGLLDDNIHSIGVDPDPTSIECAQKKYASKNKQFFGLDKIKYLVNSQTRFDIITCIEIIEHLSYQEYYKLIQNAYKLLKKDGIFLVSTPNYHSMYPILELIASWFSKTDFHEHQSRFSKNFLKQTLLQSGFKKVDVICYQGISFIFASIHWGLANKFLKIERKTLEKLYGFLLYAEAQKV